MGKYPPWTEEEDELVMLASPEDLKDREALKSLSKQLGRTHGALRTRRCNLKKRGEQFDPLLKWLPEEDKEVIAGIEELARKMRRRPSAVLKRYIILAGLPRWKIT